MGPELPVLQGTGVKYVQYGELEAADGGGDIIKSK